MTISLLIAWRYISKTKNIKGISTMIKISFLSILIGTFALTLAISIVSGFEKATYEKMQNIHPQITIQSQNNFLNYDKISEILDKEFTEIEAYSPSALEFAIIKEDNNTISNLIAIKGINLKNENKTNNFFSKIIQKNNNNLDNILSNNKVIIGEKVAKERNLSINDEITLLIPQKINSFNLGFKNKRIIISALFKTGIDDFDNKVIFSSLDFITKVFANSGISEIGIKLKKNVDEKEIIQKLKERFKLNVYSWKDLYPALVSSLKLERYIVLFIFLLISMVAGINVISLLFMIINYKMHDLIILKSMGLKYLEIQKIFLILGFFITFTANISGMILAFIFGLFLDNYPFIELPDSYYATHLPIDLNLENFVIIFVIATLVGIIFSLIPTIKTINGNIADYLKK